jgi:predicted RNA-binding protein
MNNLDAIWWET